MTFMFTTSSRVLIAVLWLPWFVCAEVPGLETSDPLSLDGYIKYTLTSTQYKDTTELDQLVTQRLNATYQFDDAWQWHTSIRSVFASTNSSNSQSTLLLDDNTNFMDLSNTWLDKKEAVGQSALDRLYVDWQDKNYLVRLGRFRVNWGMTTVWNPNDIFNAYSIYDIDYPEGAGTDALYVTKTLDYASEINWVYSPNENKERDSYSARYLFNVNGWDGQAIISQSKINRVVGFGFSGDIKGAAFRGETSWFEPLGSHWKNTNERLDQALVTSMETRYHVGGVRNWMITAAILHTTNPVDATDNLKELGAAASARALSFSELTGYVDMSFDLSSLHRVTLLSSYYQDNSYFYGITSNYSLASCSSLVFVLQRFDGPVDSVFGQSQNTILSASIDWAF
ncbi:hypothetical protein [Marinomonas algarum]|uniref:Porin n=1 Tax=Marinomonas algarum TaxID=2883105 RepID=A0A9X1ILG7_9GAMM|nr:hypothetical protein [Marinomonas algarum]MCB5161694.1 hypothetical protein [Marinomonas algarum]